MKENIISTKPPNRFAGVNGFKDKTLLITGATGFLGKVLIEKVLRTCNSVKAIYVIIRSKKGKSAQERMKLIFEDPLFDLLKKTFGKKVLEKVIVIQGDILEPNLGLSKEYLKLLEEEVEIIYHMAATVRFDEPFKKTVLLNTRGTKYTLDFAKKCNKLMVFGHVSTAYCHLGEKVLYDKAYQPPADPHTIINLIDSLDEETIDVVAKKLMGNSPNPYSFSKALAEDLVNDEMDNLPVIILRPSVVIPMWKDPIPGWTDNINGPTGLLIAGGKGIVRTMYGNPKAYADYLPVDVAANVTMLATYDYLNHRTRRFYNLTSSFEIKVTFEELAEVGKKVSLSKIPLNWVIWYPGGSMTSSRILHNTRVVLYHYIPALILDGLTLLTGNKPILWKIQQRISKGFEILEFYSTNQWYFNNDNILEARKFMNETEKEIYEVYTQSFNFEDYMYHSTHAARLYILKEGDETLPTARRHLQMMWAVDKVCKSIIVVYFFYLLLQFVVYPFLNKAHFTTLNFDA